MNKIFQVSTVKALEAGYLKPIINVEELLCHGDTGIGMFENADGEMVIEVNGEKIERESGEYTFIMPDEDVEINAWIDTSGYPGA